MEEEEPINCYTERNRGEKLDEIIEIVDIKNYEIEKDNKLYIVIIGKSKNKKYLIIQCKGKGIIHKYELKLTLDNLINLSKSFNSCESIDEAHILLSDIFKSNKVLIKEIIDGKIMKLNIKISLMNGKKQSEELNLLCSEENKDYILNELCNRICTLEDDMKLLKEEINELKKEIKVLNGKKISTPPPINKANSFRNRFNRNYFKVNQIKNGIENIEQEKESISSYIASNKDKDNRVLIEEVKNDTQKEIKNETKKEVKKEEKNEVSKGDPLKLEFEKTLTDSAYCPSNIDNTFTIFNSVDNNNLLIYGTKNSNLECYDLNNQKIIISISSAHKDEITTIRHYLDKENNRDLLLTGSRDCNVKLWDIKDFSCLLDIPESHIKHELYSTCIMIDEKENSNYIITTSNDNTEYIKVFDFEGKISKKIEDSDDNTVFVDTFYDNIDSKHYIITGNRGYIKSFDFQKSKLYKEYINDESSWGHYSIMIVNERRITKLFESSYDNFVRIWNFHTGKLLKSINLSTGLFGMCFWNENYLLVGGFDKTIKLVDLRNDKPIKTFTGHSRKVCTIKKIILPEYGECLVSQGFMNDQIKLWIIKS